MTVARSISGWARDDDREVGAVERLLERQRTQVALPELGHVGVVVDDVGAAIGEQVEDLQRR
jgi:hypothetical protein